MATTQEAMAFERGIRPVLEIVLTDKLEAVLRFRPSPELEARIEELAHKSTEGELTDRERSEYEGYVRANKVRCCAATASASDGRPVVTVNPATRAAVRARANNRCEYCHLHQTDSPLATLHIEHIVPRCHGGADELDNLALRASTATSIRVPT